MRIQLHLGLILALCGTSLTQPAARDLYSVQAASVASATDLSATYSGVGLTLVECAERLERLGALLRERGYEGRRDTRLDEGVTVTRWYDRKTNSTVVVWIYSSGVKHNLEVGRFVWKMRWNEMLIPY